MRVVWKYELPVWDGEFRVTVPVGAEFATLAVQAGGDGEVVAWFVVDPTEPRMEARTFFARDTGQTLGDEVGALRDRLRYIGTVQVFLRQLSAWTVRHVWMAA